MQASQSERPEEPAFRATSRCGPDYSLRQKIRRGRDARNPVLTGFSHPRTFPLPLGQMSPCLTSYLSEVTPGHSCCFVVCSAPQR